MFAFLVFVAILAVGTNHPILGLSIAIAMIGTLIVEILDGILQLMKAEREDKKTFINRQMSQKVAGHPGQY